MSVKKHVLIICHSAAGQMYLGVLLNRIWYSPVLAKSPEEALLLARTNDFSLILYDGDVSDPDLQRTVRLLRTDLSLRDKPLVVFMSGGQPTLGQSLLDRGCSAVLTKPLDLAIVYGVLAKLSGQPRNTPRIPLTIPVEIEEGRPAKVLTTVNLSEGGLYLRTSAPLPEGTSLRVRFILPHDTEVIELDVIVVRTLPFGAASSMDPGMGVQFANMPQDIRERIRNFVQWEMIGDLEWKPNI